MRGASREEIEEAMASGDAEHPLAVAVAGAITDYTSAFERQVERAGGFPHVLRLAEPTSATQAYALELFAAELRQAGIKVRLTSADTNAT